jgi:hypothetical protein
VTFLHPEGDTGPKLRSYAAAGVPVYILINRETKTAHCYTAPVLPGDDPKKAYYDAEAKGNGARLRGRCHSNTQRGKGHAAKVSCGGQG